MTVKGNPENSSEYSQLMYLIMYNCKVQNIKRAPTTQQQQQNQQPNPKQREYGMYIQQTIIQPLK